MQIILDTYGLSLSVRNNCFLISSGNEKRLVHPSRVSSFLVTMPCRLSTPAILLAVSNGIAITICTRSGHPEAKLWSPRFLNTAKLRRKQYAYTTCIAGREWSKTMIKLKLNSQAKNLKFLADRKPALKEEVTKSSAEINRLLDYIDRIDFTETKWLKNLRYFEASAAQHYWRLVGVKLPAPFNFTHRVKKDPTDSFNPCINYLYGMLKNQVETGILSAGLDPALGFMHRDGYNLPSLVFDIMEPFRPLTDRLLIESILMGKLKNVAATEENNEHKLTRDGRKKLIQVFNEKLHKTMLFNNKKTSLLNHILMAIGQLSKKIREYET